VLLEGVYDPWSLGRRYYLTTGERRSVFQAFESSVELGQVFFGHRLTGDRRRNLTFRSPNPLASTRQAQASRSWASLISQAIPTVVAHPDRSRDQRRSRRLDGSVCEQPASHGGLQRCGRGRPPHHGTQNGHLLLDEERNWDSSCKTSTLRTGC